MGAENRELQIGIAVSADTTGAKEASAAIKDVGTAAENLSKSTTGAATTAEELAKQFVDSNAKAAEWGQTIAKLNNEQLLQLEEKLREQIKQQEKLRQSTDDLKKKLTDTYSLRTDGLERTMQGTAGRSQQAARAVEGATAAVKQMQTASAGARNVIEGLSQGGFGGLIRAGNGAATVVRSLATGALGTVLLPVLGASAVALALLKKRSEDAEKATKKMFEEAAAESVRLKDAFEAIDNAQQKSLDAQLARVAKLTARYDDLIGRIEAADNRIRQSQKLEADTKLAEIDRDEAKALAKATTPEARAKIEQDATAKRERFKANAAEIELQNQATKGQFQIDRADEESRKLRSGRDQLELDAASKRGEANGAKAYATQVATEKGVASEEAAAARENAKVLEEGAVKSEDALSKFVAALEAATAKLDAQRAEGKAAIEQARGGQALRAIETDTAATRARTEAEPKRAALRRQAQEAMDRGDFAAQDKAVAELRGVEAALKVSTETAKKAGGQIAAAIVANADAQAEKDKVVIKALDKQKRQIENAR
jgi:hypothetical protein